jgi:hypothetical protein
MARERDISAAHRNYPRQFGGGISRILHVLRRKQWVEDFCYVALDRAPSIISPRHTGGVLRTAHWLYTVPAKRAGQLALRSSRAQH